MVELKSIIEHLTEFIKIIDDLVNIDVNLEDEDKTLHTYNVRYLSPLAFSPWRKFKQP
jgi:hypothetical protein